MLPWVYDGLTTLWNSFDWAKAANIGAIVLAIYTWLKFVKPMLRGVARFLEDWNGEAKRNGIVPRPGIMSRMQWLEQQNELFIQSEMRQNERIATLELQNAELRRAVKNIEGLIKPVSTFVREHTGAVPTVPSARSES